MNKKEILIDTIPQYLTELLSNTVSELYKEQIRQKQYSNSIPYREGQRHAFIAWSGGLDSTTSLLMALESNIEITTVNFNYGQSYFEKEKERIETIIMEADSNFPNNKWRNHVAIDISWLDKKTKELLPGEWEHIFPVRNYIILKEIVSLAKDFDYPEVWFSCVEGEILFSGGDKSTVFLTEATRDFLLDNVRLVTPQIGMNKSDMVRWARDKKERYNILKKSISCFTGDGMDHCGTCRSCYHRAVGFYAAGMIEDVGFTPTKEGFKEMIEYHEERISQDNPYSITKQEDIRKFHKYLNR